jgi:MoxR-like ATPase
MADVVGTMIYNIKQNEFIKKDLFLLISFWQMRFNRAPAKVQSALLEAMQENK